MWVLVLVRVPVRVPVPGRVPRRARVLVPVPVRPMVRVQSVRRLRRCWIRSPERHR
jgi:hypothetical protein